MANSNLQAYREASDKLVIMNNLENSTISWQQPPTRFIKVNVDFTMLPMANTFGVRIMLRDDRG